MKIYCTVLSTINCNLHYPGVIENINTISIISSSVYVFSLLKFCYPKFGICHMIVTEKGESRELDMGDRGSDTSSS